MVARAALRSTLACLGLGFVLASAQTKPTLSVTPNPATAGQAFVLTLQGLSTDCANSYARESVTVTGTRIDLRYTTTVMVQPTDPPQPVTCPIPISAGPSGTTSAIVANLPMFLMPALAAGKYEVWATDVPECVYNGCKIAVTSVSAGSLEVRKAAEPTYTFTPTAAIAGQKFDLHLLSYGFSCATIYSDLIVHVVGNMITLSFFSKEPTDVACPAVYMPYGPVFKMPALAAGSYTIQVDRNAMNAAPVAAGTLQVTESVRRSGWYLKQDHVQPDAPFQMQLLRDSLATCTNFTNLNAQVFASGIFASFLMQTGKCAAISAEPLGPVFSMPALKTGSYPVYVTELQPCEVAVPMCVVERDMMLPSDTLVVAKSLALRMSALRAGAPKVEMAGNLAVFALPEGAPGAWAAELMALDGRVLAAGTLVGAPGDRVSMDVGRAPAKAVSLLRLTSPSGSQRLLPIIR